MAPDGKLPGILRLTPDIRRCIFLHAGLGQRPHYGGTAPVVYDLGHPARCDTTKSPDSLEQEFQRFHGLLLSCRTIYAEASTLLYSANWFIVRYQPRRSLAALRALTPHALAALTSLKIIFNQASCHQEKIGSEGSGNCCSSGRHASGCIVWEHEYDHDLPLDGSGPLSEALLADWHVTAAHLAPHIVAGQLELTLVCDLCPDDVQTARAVLGTLRLLPRLKDCHIRLCEMRDPRLQQLAREAVLQARGILAPSEAPAFPGVARPRLVNLPRELRLRILEYTDLVTPFNEITWSRTSRGYRTGPGSCPVLDGSRDCPPEFHHHGCQFLQCHQAAWPQPSIGCLCRLRHAAASSRCKCWAPPTPLFLACRTLHADATLTLYTRNRLIVIDSPSTNPYHPWPPGDYRHAAFAASHFLRHVLPRPALRHIRCLEVVFAPFTHLSRPREGHPALREWGEMWAWAAGGLNLPALALRLVVAGGEIEPRGGADMTRAQGKEVLAVYNALLAPLRLLGSSGGGGGGGGRLARFYAELAWPLQWARGEGGGGEGEEEQRWRERVEEKNRELKSRAEGFVMGERYDGRIEAAGGAEPRKSVWTWSYRSEY